MTTQYLDPTADEIYLNQRADLCPWDGSEVTEEGCYCRRCPDCSEYFMDRLRKDYDDGRPARQQCPDCKGDLCQDNL